MARRLTMGFELAEAIEHNGTLETYSSVTQTVSSAAARTGGYGWSIYSATNGGAYVTQVFADMPQELYCRMAIKAVTLDPSSTDPVGLLGFYDQATCHVSIALRQTDNRIIVTRGGGDGQLGQGTGATELDVGDIVLAEGSWYVIEVYVKISNTVGSVIVKINGATDASFSGDTGATANEYVDVIRIGWQAQNGPHQGYIDDVGINDTTGSYQNTWLGSGGVYLLMPTSDGATSAWTPLSGTDHYAMVDEVPDDGNTSYLYDNVSGQTETFGLADLPSQVTDVDLVQVVWQVALSQAGSASMEDVVRPGSTDRAGTAQSVVNEEPSYQLYHGDVHYVNPDTVAAWTPAEVNASEAGFKVA